MMKKKTRDQGTILIFALWTLALLVVFSVYIGIGVRQRMILVQRLESRSKLYYSAASGIRKAIAVLNHVRSIPGAMLVSEARAKLLNNQEVFSNIQLNGVNVDVSYQIFDKSFSENKKQYGMMEEAAKININFADQRTLIRLFQLVLGYDSEKAEELALAIVDWRTKGEGRLEGFFSDEYYKNLEHPYAPKNASFEVLDEALLVEGMTSEILDRLRYFLTIYGDGRININTASLHVLRALGFEEALAEKIIERRAGEDGIEGTEDDYVFQSEDGLTFLLRLSSVATENDTLFAQQLFEDEQFRVDSDIYSIEAFAAIGQQQMKIRCVYDASVQTIIYWQET